MLTFITKDTTLIIKGATCYIKSILEAFNGTWSPTPDSKSLDDFGFWTISIEHDSPDFRYGLDLAAQRGFKLALEQKIIDEKKRTDEYLSPGNQKKLHDEMVRFRLKRKIRSEGKEFAWICCKSCQVVDWTEEQVLCSVHMN